MGLFSLNRNWDEFNFYDTSVLSCSFSDIRKVFEDNHYKEGSMGGSISFCFAFMWKEDVIGGAVYGPPRHTKSYDSNVIDLRRFALVEEAPRNSESFFLGKTLREIKKRGLADAVLTFADETQGHKGVIYKACNFKYLGKTPSSKHLLWRGKQYHMRSLTIDRPYSYELRKAVSNGDAIIVNGLPKHKYMYFINDKNRSTKK